MCVIFAMAVVLGVSACGGPCADKKCGELCNSWAAEPQSYQCNSAGACVDISREPTGCGSSGDVGGSNEAQAEAR